MASDPQSTAPALGRVPHLEFPMSPFEHQGACPPCWGSRPGPGLWGKGRLRPWGGREGSLGPVEGIETQPSPGEMHAGLELSRELPVAKGELRGERRAGSASQQGPGQPLGPPASSVGCAMAPALSQSCSGWVGLVFSRAGGKCAPRAPAVPSTCHPEAHEPSARAHGWEQLAAGSPRNKGCFEQPARLFLALQPADCPGSAETHSLCGLSGSPWR